MVLTVCRAIRNTELQAARDLYYTYVGVQLERKVNKGKNLFTQFWELFSVPRNRRATWATWIVMFGQQFCGVNIIGERYQPLLPSQSLPLVHVSHF